MVCFLFEKSHLVCMMFIRRHVPVAVFVLFTGVIFSKIYYVFLLLLYKNILDAIINGSVKIRCS